jgi:hypothetical protein
MIQKRKRRKREHSHANMHKSLARRSLARLDGIVRSAGPAQKARYDLSKIYDLHDVNIFHISDHFIPELHQSKALSESYPKPCSKVS